MPYFGFLTRTENLTDVIAKLSDDAPRLANQLQALQASDAVNETMRNRIGSAVMLLREFSK